MSLLLQIIVIIDKFGEGTYTGDLVGAACRHGSGRTVYKRGSANYSHYTGATYEGSYSNNKASGEGVLTLLDGEVYRGEFRADLKHGRGILQLSNGDTYRGKFVDGVKQGEGEYTWANGDKYTGEWRRDKRNGKGVLNRLKADEENRSVRMTAAMNVIQGFIDRK